MLPWYRSRSDPNIVANLQQDTNSQKNDSSSNLKTPTSLGAGEVVMSWDQNVTIQIIHYSTYVSKE